MLSIGGRQGFGRHVWCATFENMVTMKKVREVLS